nr:MAG TPA: hypothetical protein [Caudoviricetes sp.]
MLQSLYTIYHNKPRCQCRHEPVLARYLLG